MGLGSFLFVYRTVLVQCSRTELRYSVPVPEGCPGRTEGTGGEWGGNSPPPWHGYTHPAVPIRAVAETLSRRISNPGRFLVRRRRL